jgi:hypothetical protein
MVIRGLINVLLCLFWVDSNSMQWDLGDRCFFETEVRLRGAQLAAALCKLNWKAASTIR